MQIRHTLRLLSQQARMQHVRKQVVVPIPVPPVVESDDEQVRSLQRLKHRFPAILAGDGIAQWAAQPVEYRSLLEKAPDRFGLTL